MKSKGYCVLVEYVDGMIRLNVCLVLVEGNFVFMLVVIVGQFLMGFRGTVFFWYEMGVLLLCFF